MEGMDLDNKRNRKPLWAFVIAVLCSFIIWAVLFILDPGGEQRVAFSFNGADWFMDFYNTAYYGVGRTPYTWGNLAAHNYLPIAYLMMYPFSLLYPSNLPIQYEWRNTQIGADIFAVYLVTSFLFLFLCLWTASKKTRGQKVALIAACFFNGLMLNNVDRGNQIIFVTACVCLYLMTVDSQKTPLRHLGYMCLALSTCMKIYPALFGVLLIYKKRWKDIGWYVLYGLILAVLPFFWLEAPLKDSVIGYLKGMYAHARNYAEEGEYGFFTFLGKNTLTTVLGYILCAVCLWRARHLERRWQRTLLITLAVFLTSGQQNYYNALYFLFPIVLFFNESSHDRSDWIHVACFVALLSPVRFSFGWFDVILLRNLACLGMTGLLLYKSFTKISERSVAK